MTQPTSDDATGIGILRATITLLVLAHHAVLAYHPFAPPAFDSLHAAPFWQAFPVVDTDRWHGALWLVGVNDTFFMSLMFLISGLFVWRSLTRKGGAHHLRDRARRLGVPFLVGAALLAPLAYVPAYLQTGAPVTWAAFWREWVTLASWPSGPVWFLWVLLAYNLLAVALYRLAPTWGSRLGALLAERSPVVVFAALVAASAAAYLPLALTWGSMHWSAVGPFAIQTSRAIHYAVYFAFGIALGARGLERGVVAPGGRLAARWPLWVIAGGAAFWLSVEAATRDFAAGGTGLWHVASSLAFVVACAALSFAFVACFVRTRWPRSRILDSLRANAFTMYVVHYGFASWLQYAMLDVDLPGVAKAALAFTGTVALSWATAAALRGIARTVRAAPCMAVPARAADQPAA